MSEGKSTLKLKTTLSVSLPKFSSTFYQCPAINSASRKVTFEPVQCSRAPCCSTLNVSVYDLLQLLALTGMLHLKFVLFNKIHTTWLSSSNQTTSSAECDHPKKEQGRVQKRHVHSTDQLKPQNQGHTGPYIPVQENPSFLLGCKSYLQTSAFSCSSNSRAASVKPSFRRLPGALEGSVYSRWSGYKEWAAHGWEKTNKK